MNNPSELDVANMDPDEIIMATLVGVDVANADDRTVIDALQGAKALMEAAGDIPDSQIRESLADHIKSNYHLNKRSAVNLAFPRELSRPRPVSARRAKLNSDDRFARMLKGEDSQQDDEPEHKDVDLISQIEHFHKGPLTAYAAELARVAQMPRNTTLLVALGIFSAIACRAYSVRYQNSGNEPLSIFILTEQPPATGKTRILKDLQCSFLGMIKQRRQQLLNEIEQADDDEDAKSELQALVNMLPYWLTDATPEAIDQTLSTTGGFFSLASSEKGVIHTLIANRSDRHSNTDVLLKGFNGEHHHSARVTRGGYSGSVVGNVVAIAQPGLIQDAFNAANGNGLAERFLVLSEPHLLGQRKHGGIRPIEESVSREYQQACQALFSTLPTTKTDFEALPQLALSDQAWTAIHTAQNLLEPTLADAGANSSEILRGFIGKLPIHVMKIASVLHLAAYDPVKVPTVADECVRAALSVFKALAAHLRHLIQTDCLADRTPRQHAIINTLKKNSRPMSKLIDTLRKRSSFGGREDVRGEIVKMLDRGDIIETAETQGFEDPVLSLPRR